MKNWNNAHRETLQHEYECGEELLTEEHKGYRRSASAPIGVFDSGAGGLTILTALREELPHERFIYLGDTAHCPYGVRSDEEITQLTLDACRFLMQHEVKMIIIACNTASQAALTTLRATISELPFIGVVPAVKPAARLTRKGRIGIAATNQAAKALYLRQLIDEFAEGIEAFAVGCPDLVTLVEQGQLDGPDVEETVRQALQPVLAEEIDVLVLGCTHFPALRHVIERVVGPRVQVIDSGQAIARRARSVLQTDNMLAPATLYNSEGGELELWSTGDPALFSPVATKILGRPVSARQAQAVIKGVL